MGGGGAADGVAATMVHGRSWQGSVAAVAFGAMALGLAALAGSCPTGAEQGEDFDAETGYRIAHYRAPVPRTVPGGTPVDMEQIDQLVATEGALLLDVMPSEGPGADPLTGVWRLAKPHTTIAGAVWLADVGRGRIDQRLDAYFRDNLARLTDGDTARPIVIFCQADCWMAWNAVQRAAKWGYSRLYWYRDGIDGWRDWERPLAPASPVPMQPASGAR